jgi:3-hydroxyisobutyrate dehydrogenase-like beta-hydroxyacid dehydrogenase
MRVGLIGLGIMGSRFVSRLVAAGLTPLAYDVAPAARETAAARGADVRSSVAEVARSCDVLLTSLPMPADVEAVHREAAEAARAGQVFVDLSTIDPATARRIATLLAPRGVAFLDAPVSGGLQGAEAGTLAIMVGGDAAALDRARPALAPLAARVVHVGGVGAGSVVKLCNQLIVGAGTIAAMEAATFAARAGVDPALVLEVLSNSVGDSVVLRRSIRDFVLKRDFTAQFALRLLAKDLRLYVAEAAAVGTPTPAGAPISALYEDALAAGLGGEDYAAILKLIEKMAGAVATPA